MPTVSEERMARLSVHLNNYTEKSLISQCALYLACYINGKQLEKYLRNDPLPLRKIRKNRSPKRAPLLNALGTSNIH